MNPPGPLREQFICYVILCLGGWETLNPAKFLPFHFVKLALLTSLVKDKQHPLKSDLYYVEKCPNLGRSSVKSCKQETNCPNCRFSVFYFLFFRMRFRVGGKDLKQVKSVFVRSKKIELFRRKKMSHEAEHCRDSGTAIPLPILILILISNLIC